MRTKSNVRQPCNHDKVKENAESVDGSANNLSEISKVMVSGSNEMLNKTTDVSSSSEQMSLTVSSMASAAEEMNMNVKNVASTAEEMSTNIENNKICGRYYRTWYQ